MTEKIKCPKCFSKFTKKYINWTKDRYSLICKPCEKLHPYKGFRAYYDENDGLYELTTYFKIEDYNFSLHISRNYKSKYIVLIYLEGNQSYSPKSLIKEFDGLKLIDQDIDILDFNSIFSFFKKECVRWNKLKAFYDYSLPYL